MATRKSVRRTGEAPTKKRTHLKRTAKRSRKSAQKKKWSRKVTEHSNALDLEQNVFKKKDPKKIARSLKRSAEHSKKKKRIIPVGHVNVEFLYQSCRKRFDEERQTTVGKSQERIEEIISQGGE